MPEQKPTKKNLVVDSSSEVSRLKEVDGVKVGDVDTPGVGLGALRPVLLDVHPKEADVNSVLLLKGEHCPSAVREVVQHVASVHIPGEKNNFQLEILRIANLVFNLVSIEKIICVEIMIWV